MRDLFETHPTNVETPSDPFSMNLTLEENVINMKRLIRHATVMNNRLPGLINAYYLGYLLIERVNTPVQAKQCRRKLTKHYRDAAVRTYRLFNILGPKQLNRTRYTTHVMLRKLSQNEFHQVVKEAVLIIAGAIN